MMTQIDFIVILPLHNEALLLLAVHSSACEKPMQMLHLCFKPFACSLHERTLLPITISDLHIVHSSLITELSASNNRAENYLHPPF